MKDTGVYGARRRSASASASPGKMCPPVPPAAITIEVPKDLPGRLRLRAP